MTLSKTTTEEWYKWQIKEIVNEFFSYMSYYTDDVTIVYNELTKKIDSFAENENNPDADYCVFIYRYTNKNVNKRKMVNVIFKEFKNLNLND